MNYLMLSDLAGTFSFWFDLFKDLQITAKLMHVEVRALVVVVPT